MIRVTTELSMIRFERVSMVKPMKNFCWSITKEEWTSAKIIKEIILKQRANARILRSLNFEHQRIMMKMSRKDRKLTNR